MLNRNEIYNKLLDTVKTVYPFKEATRRPKLWADCNNKPAIYLEEESELADSSVRGVPIKWTLNVQLIVYTQIGASAQTTPFDELNNIIDALIELWQPSNNYRGVQNLGGLVESSYINGSIDKFGANNNMTGAIAIIPVQLIVANR